VSLGTRDSKKANEKVHAWETHQRVIERSAAVSLADAWTSMLADLEARKLSHQTIRKYKLLDRQMKAYGEERGFKMLAQFDLDVLSKFRATWKDGPRTAGKKLERLRAFFRFAHDRQWVESNPATRIKLPKVSIRPTMPLTHEEMVKILTACDSLQITTPIEGKLNAHRLKTLVLLMRYTGMRVSDAVTLTSDRLDGKRLFLYTQKTGVPVYTGFGPEGSRSNTANDGHAIFLERAGQARDGDLSLADAAQENIRSGGSVEGTRQRDFASLPRHVRGGAAACRCAD
jgi:integrase